MPAHATGLRALAAARLPASFFRRDASEVARELIGCALVHRGRAGVIVETEAYLGPEDRASHARFGPTGRTEVMFGPGGVAYVYLCYGIHQLFNIITGQAGQPQAVLIRAIAPHLGLPDDPAVGRGPGKLTDALGIDRRHDRRDLARGALFVARARAPEAAGAGEPPPIAIGPRIGVDYAGACAARPLRYWWRDHPAVSRSPRSPRSPRSAASRSPPPRSTESTRRSR
jgi:DNA-3-methyladenine glycosylase